MAADRAQMERELTQLLEKIMRLIPTLPDDRLEDVLLSVRQATRFMDANVTGKADKTAAMTKLKGYLESTDTNSDESDHHIPYSRKISHPIPESSTELTTDYSSPSLFSRRLGGGGGGKAHGSSRSSSRNSPKMHLPKVSLSSPDKLITIAQRSEPSVKDMAEFNSPDLPSKRTVKKEEGGSGGHKGSRKATKLLDSSADDDEEDEEEVRQKPTAAAAPDRGSRPNEFGSPRQTQARSMLMKLAAPKMSDSDELDPEQMRRELRAMLESAKKNISRLNTDAFPQATELFNDVLQKISK